MGIIKLNNQSLNVEIKNGDFFVDGREVAVDINEMDQNRFILFHRNKAHQLEVLSQIDALTYLVRLNNKTVTIEIKGDKSILLEKLGMQAVGKEEISEVRAPMPGLILDIAVKAGDTVEKEDVLLVLEAMKMENALKSPRSGTIKAVKVKAGEGVEKNQVLIQF